MFSNQIDGNMSLVENHKLINDSLKHFCVLFNKYDIDYYIVGALPCFIKTKQKLFRYHDDIDIMRSIDFEEYISEQQYPFCYAKYGDVYLTFSKFNGISIMNRVKTEEEAILSLVSACEADDSVNLDNLFMHVIDNRHYNLEKPQEFVL